MRRAGGIRAAEPQPSAATASFPRTTSSLKLMLSNMYASRLASGLMDSSGMARNSVEVMKPCTQAQAGHCRRWVGLQLAVPIHGSCGGGGGGSGQAHAPLGT